MHRGGLCASSRAIVARVGDELSNGLETVDPLLTMLTGSGGCRGQSASMMGRVTRCQQQLRLLPMPRRARRAARAGAPGRERARDRRSARSSASPLRASLRRGPRARSGTRHRCARGGRSLGSSASRSAAGTAPAKYFSRYGRTSGLSQSARLRLLRTCTTSATRPGSRRLVFILSTGLDSSGVRATSGSRASSLITRHRTQKRRSGDPARHWIRNRIDGWIESSLACRSSTNRTSDDSLEVLRRPPTARQRMHRKLLSHFAVVVDRHVSRVGVNTEELLDARLDAGPRVLRVSRSRRCSHRAPSSSIRLYIAGTKREVLRSGLRCGDPGEERIREHVPQWTDTELIARLGWTVVVEQWERVVTLRERTEDPAGTTRRRLCSHPCRPHVGFMPKTIARWRSAKRKTTTPSAPRTPGRDRCRRA
jgi:hypothetical protein